MHCDGGGQFGRAHASDQLVIIYIFMYLQDKLSTKCKGDIEHDFYKNKPVSLQQYLTVIESIVFVIANNSSYFTFLGPEIPRGRMCPNVF